MSPEPDLDDPRVFEAVQEYLAALEAGRRLDRSTFLAQHKDIAPALAECIAGLDLVHNAGSKLRETAPTPTPAAEPPTALGDFRIIRELGRGGMGVVYEAIQLSLGRRVALKVLPFAAALDARQLQRFQNEARAAAHLHHQNIVPVHGVGCERGVHFYAMQLIDGQNLASLVEDMRQPGVGATRHQPASAPTGDFPSRTLETRSELGAQLTTLRTEKPGGFYRTIARLAAQAADALEYAHQNGIVHRDIKPANLLVDGGGNLWITDFGLALVQADVGLTQSGDLLGTLRYMSPEQAGGPRGLIDHRTDVYSLGVTLYELLTLRPIFDGADRRALLHQIMHEEPPVPRVVDRAIPLDLETIVLKAIGKHPADRYATARDMAEDLNRFLRDEPIRARRATVVQRVRKWMRRHPSVPVTATILLILLTLGSVGSALLVRNEQAKERQRAKEAEDRLRLARRSVDEILQTAEQEMGDNPMMQGMRKKLLEWALSYYQEFVQQRSDDPEFQADLAATRDRVKKILDDLTELEGSGHLFLLNREDVLDDLGANEDQRQRLRALDRQLNEEREQEIQNFHRLAADEKRAWFVKQARAKESGAGQILTTSQIARLRQISLQTKREMAFRDPAIIAALKLTPEQQEGIKAIQADRMFIPRPEGPHPDGPHPDGPRPDGPPKFGPKGKSPDDMRRGDMDRVLNILTDEQRTRWRELIGNPMVWKRGPFQGGPGRFGPSQGPGPRPDR